MNSNFDNNNINYNHLDDAINLIQEDDPSIFWNYTKYLDINELKSIKLLKAVLITGNLEFIKNFLKRYHPEKIVVEDELFECLISYCYPRVVKLFEHHIKLIRLESVEQVARTISMRLYIVNNYASFKSYSVYPFKNFKILLNHVNHYNIINNIISNLEKNHSLSVSEMEYFKSYLSKNVLIHVGVLKLLINNNTKCYISGRDYYEYLTNFYDSKDIYYVQSIQSQSKELQDKIKEDTELIIKHSDKNNADKFQTEFEACLKQHNITYILMNYD